MTTPRYPRERHVFGDIIMYRCTRCGKIKKPGDFGIKTRAKWGLEPRCLLCMSEVRQASKTPETRERLRIKSRNLARKKAAEARAADKKYENWLWRQEQGMKVRLGKPGWSKHSDCCLQCGTFFHPHHGRGLCHKCYSRDYQGSKAHPFNREGKWSRLHDYCVECGKTDRRHGARGVCVRCLWYNHNKAKPKNPNCAHCDKPIPNVKYAAKRKYCSESCSLKAYRVRRKEREKIQMLVVDQTEIVAVEESTGQTVMPTT